MLLDIFLIIWVNIINTYIYGSSNGTYQATKQLLLKYDKVVLSFITLLYCVL